MNQIQSGFLELGVKTYIYINTWLLKNSENHLRT